MKGRECEGCGIQTGRREFVKRLLGLAPVLLVPMRVDPLSETIEYEIPASDGAFIDARNDVIIMRWQNMVYAFSLACPHQNTALRWKPEAGRFQCPKHNSKYRPDGSFISGRATRGMDRFAISRRGELVAVDLGRFYSEDRDAAGWQAAALKL